MRRFWLFLLLGAALGCEKSPVSQSSSNNPNIAVDFLFEHEGCKLYRFYDGGRAIYYANCGGRIQTSWSHPCGKGCVEQMQVQTNTF
jgi:hypothetical protein